MESNNTYKIIGAIASTITIISGSVFMGPLIPGWLNNIWLFIKTPPGLASVLLLLLLTVIIGDVYILVVLRRQPRISTSRSSKRTPRKQAGQNTPTKAV